MDHGVGNPLAGEQEQGQDRESDLKALGVELLFRDRLLTPL